MRTDLERRRYEVSELLEQCGCEKLLRGGDSRHLAERALGLAAQPESLPSPWPEVAHYRLAHLLLRSPERNDCLDQIDEHLRKACCSDATGAWEVLGPLPHVYRMVVLHLMARHSMVDPSEAEWEIDNEYKQARKELGHTLTVGQTTADSPSRGLLQHESFNLLELAVYLLELPYDSLEGVGRRDEWADLVGKGWCLVGPDPQISAVEMSEAFACAELESRGKQNLSALLFKLPYRGKAEWRVPGGQWQEVNDDWIRLLVNRLKEPNLSDEELRRRVTSDSTSSDRFRQLKRRLIAELREITGQTDLEPFVHGVGVSGLMVYGAVSLRVFRAMGR